MPYAIILKDKPNSLELRGSVRAEHLDYLNEHRARILAGGAQINDDGTGGFGGVIIYDTDERSEAEAFVANDPFTKAGLFESITVVRWRKAIFNGEKLV